MLTLGLDPGSINIGYGLLEKQGTKINYVDSGVINLGAENDYLARLSLIPGRIEKILIQHRPTHIAMESLIFVKSPTSLIKLAQARGMILSVILREYQERFFEYSPNLVKMSSTGHGHASKEGIKLFLQKLIGKSDFAYHDESDALAVALCHIMNFNSTNGQNIDAKKLKSGPRGIGASLSHKIKEQEL